MLSAAVMRELVSAVPSIQQCAHEPEKRYFSAVSLYVVLVMVSSLASSQVPFSL